MGDVHEGGCVCGGVRYRTTGMPARAAACACTWCQRRTGSAFGLSVYFEEANVEFLQGALQFRGAFENATLKFPVESPDFLFRCLRTT